MGFPTSYNVAKAEAEPKKKEVGYTAVGVDNNTQKLQEAFCECLGKRIGWEANTHERGVVELIELSYE
jgi:hypothetical protein